MATVIMIVRETIILDLLNTKNVSFLFSSYCSNHIINLIIGV
jgi:hypothetical protein